MILSQNVPSDGRSDLYEQLEEMENLVSVFNEARHMGSLEEKLNEIRSCLVDKIVSSGLNVNFGIGICVCVCVCVHVYMSSCL